MKTKERRTTSLSSKKTRGFSEETALKSPLSGKRRNRDYVNT
jgi:hypothetical protein